MHLQLPSSLCDGADCLTALSMGSRNREERPGEGGGAPCFSNSVLCPFPSSSPSWPNSTVSPDPSSGPAFRVRCPCELTPPPSL